MPQRAQDLLIFLIEDWRPAAPDLSAQLVELGFRVEVLPNILELVSKRVRRDRPAIMLVNASSLVIGDHQRWRQFLGGATASLVVVPETATASFFSDARTLGFCGLLDRPISRHKLMLALDLAVQNRRAAHRLRQETRRLQVLQERLQGDRSSQAVAPAGTNGANGGNGGSAVPLRPRACPSVAVPSRSG